MEDKTVRIDEMTLSVSAGQLTRGRAHKLAESDALRGARLVQALFGDSNCRFEDSNVVFDLVEQRLRVLRESRVRLREREGNRTNVRVSGVPGQGDFRGARTYRHIHAGLADHFNVVGREPTPHADERLAFGRCRHSSRRIAEVELNELAVPPPARVFAEAPDQVSLVEREA